LKILFEILELIMKLHYFLVGNKGKIFSK